MDLIPLGVPIRRWPRWARSGLRAMGEELAERVRRDLGWVPRYTEIEDIIRSAWRWHSSHPEGFGDAR